MKSIKLSSITALLMVLPFLMFGQEIKLEPKTKSKVNLHSPASKTSPELPTHLKEGNMKATTVKWNMESHAYGKVKAGTKIKHTFKFKNTGKEPLLISKVKPSCGCTTPSYSKELVPPGGDGFIDVTVDTSGKSGLQNNTVTVFLNTGERTKTLRLKGEVIME